MHFLASIVVPLLTAASALAQASDNSSDTCVASCTKWSNTLDSCYGIFTASPHIHGSEYSNQFLGCLCRGTLSDKEYGNDTMSQAAGICQSCANTPTIIKGDLSTFLTLCQVQKTNGTAYNASDYAPLGYKTTHANDKPQAVSAGTTVSAAPLGSAANLALASASLITASMFALW